MVFGFFVFSNELFGNIPEPNMIIILIQKNVYGYYFSNLSVYVNV